MEIELKKVIELPTLTNKSVAYSAVLYIDNKKVARVFNGGNGEKTSLTAFNSDAKNLLLAAQQYHVNPKITEDGSSSFPSFVDQLAARVLDGSKGYTNIGTMDTTKDHQKGVGPLTDSGAPVPKYKDGEKQGVDIKKKVRRKAEIDEKGKGKKY